MTPTTSAPGLRLAVFTDTAMPQLNGVSHTLDRLAEAVRARGGAVRLYTTTDPAALPDEDVVRFRSWPFPAYPGLRFALPHAAAAARDLRAWGATLVHSATHFGIGLTGRAAARAAGLPFVSSYHTGISTYGKYYRADLLARPGWGYLRWFHNGGARTFCPTRAIQRELTARGFRDIAIWGRGVDGTRFHPRWRSDVLRRRLGATDGKLLVIYVGRLATEKGLDVALAAMRRLHASDPRRFAFAFAGDGPAARRCRELAPPGTTFVGQITGEELSAFYASGDVFVFPSVSDTFGNVLLEAMASGLCLVAADTAPTREVLGPRGGVLFPGGDDAAMAECLRRLAGDEAGRARIAAGALASVRERSWTRVFDGLVSHYLTVLGAADAGARHAAAPAAVQTGWPATRRAPRAARSGR
jgi:glycosyltransferase involved in cell wall biosynthesis